VALSLTICSGLLSRALSHGVTLLWESSVVFTAVALFASVASPGLFARLDPNPLLSKYDGRSKGIPNLALSLQLSLMFLPPGRVTVEQPKRMLGKAIMRHLMLVLATLLGEGANSLMNPFVAVYLGPSLRVRSRRLDNAVDAILSSPEYMSVVVDKENRK
jgi:hypothetical protein